MVSDGLHRHLRWLLEGFTLDATVLGHHPHLVEHGDDEDRNNEDQIDFNDLGGGEGEQTEPAEEAAQAEPAVEEEEVVGGPAEVPAGVEDVLEDEEEDEGRNPFQQLKEWEERQRKAAQEEGKRLKKT